MNDDDILAIHELLVNAAKTEEDFVHYGDVIRMAHIGHLPEGALEGALGQVFYEVNEYDWSQDPKRPMLSSIAVSSATGSPGNGFYKFAREKGKPTGRTENEQLEFWLSELTKLRAYWRTHSQTTFRELPITYNAVRDAFRDFDAEFPDTDDYYHWLENDGYKFAIEFEGRLYPPKYILSIVTRIEVGKFSGGDQTNRVFEELGFNVIDKPQGATQRRVLYAPTYLLTWNPAKGGWSNFQQDWEAVYAGFRPRLRWSCGNTKSIEVGDRIFLIRLGWREDVTGIMASGRVTQAPYEDETWNPEGASTTALYIEFEPDVLLNPEGDMLLEPKLVSEDFNWHPQRSGVTIPTDIVERLEDFWEQHVEGVTLLLEQPDRTPSSRTFMEGKKTLVSNYQYERDPRARAECIRLFGTTCVICGFNFGATYGELGEGFIHVHHLTPVAERGEKYEIKPESDLRPVCPNCHAMLHRNSPPYTIEELQHLLRR